MNPGREKGWFLTTTDRVSLWLHEPEPGSAEWRAVRSAAEAYVRGLNTLDLDGFFELLADEVIYTSMWVFKNREGKEAVAAHLARKLAAIKIGLAAIRVRAELAVSAAGWCAAVSQPPENPPSVVTIFEVRGGKVTGINVCMPELVPVRLTGLRPGLEERTVTGDAPIPPEKKGGKEL